MTKHNGSNQKFDPNMLLILLLILSAYSRKPMYYQNIKDAKDNEKSKKSDIGYTGGTCSEEVNLHEKESCNLIESGNQESSSNFLDSSTNNLPAKEDCNMSKENNNVNINNNDNNQCFEEVSNNKDNVTIEESSSYDDKNKLNDSDKIMVNDVSEDNAWSTNSSFSNDINFCHVVNSKIFPEYPNEPIILKEECNRLIINVPVLLSQFEIEFDCETLIKLDRPALDIKRTKKNVFLNECKLLPKANKLFVSGIVRKNLEYLTECDIRHITVEIPFRGTTQVQYFTKPVINSSIEQLEIETDISEKTNISTEYFNDKISCKLVSDEITDLDVIAEAKCKNENPECEKPFETIIEKMIVKLNLKLIQEQQISIDK